MEPLDIPRWKSEANLTNARDDPKLKSKNRFKFWKSKEGKGKLEKVKENTKPKSKKDLVERVSHLEDELDTAQRHNAFYDDNIFGFQNTIVGYMKSNGFEYLLLNEEMHNLGACSEYLQTMELHELSEIIEVLIIEAAGVKGKLSLIFT